jgi:hypothetical protein
MTTASIVPFDTKPERIQSMSTTIHTYLEKRKIKSLIKIHASKNVADGACDLIQSYGFGPIFPNTILLGDPSDENPIASYVDILYTAITYERNIIIVKETSTDDPEEVKKKKTRRIDVWWDQESENAGLLLAIAFLMRSSPNWNHEPLAVHVILTADTDEPDVKARINKTVGKMRLHADIVVHENRDKKSHFDIITAVSVDADFVLLGLHPPKQTTEKDAYQRYFEGLIDKIDPLPATGLVMALEELDFDQLFIE